MNLCYGIWLTFTQAKKVVSYAESGSEDFDDDEDAFRPKRKATTSRATKRRKVSESAEEDNFDLDAASEDGTDGQQDLHTIY